MNIGPMARPAPYKANGFSRNSGVIGLKVTMGKWLPNSESSFSLQEGEVHRRDF
jgi:hypothetical protein